MDENTKFFTQDLVGFPINKAADWLEGYVDWLNKYTRDEQPCIINSDNLAANNFHDEVGRNGYVSTESGSSEAQFITIRACAMAYLATKNIKWLNKAVNMANAALKILFRDKEIPTTFDPSNIWLPHWLFDVKGNFTSEKYYLDYQAHFENGTTSFNTEYEARKIFSVRAIDAKLQWQNPYAEIVGTSYEVGNYTAEGNSFTVNLSDNYTGDALVVYSDFGGPTIAKNEVYEAWPIWRKLEDTEIDCAVDSIWWAYDSFKLLSEITGNSKFTNALNYLKEVIPHVLNVNNSNDYFTTDTSGNPCSASGSYLYQDRTPAATISRNENTGMINFNIPDGNGSVQLGRCGLKDSWYNDDVAIEIKLLSNLANKVLLYIDPQADYMENTRWISSINVQGIGNFETFTLHRKDFVRTGNLIWNMEYLSHSSDQFYNGPNGSVTLSDSKDENEKRARHIDFNRGTETGYTTINTTDDNGNPITKEISYTYPGWAQYDIMWDKNVITLNSLPNFHYKSSGKINIRIKDGNGWFWNAPLPPSASFTDYTPNLSGFSPNDYQTNSGNAPSSPVFPITEILFDAVDVNCSADLGWLGEFEFMPLNENICGIVLSVTSPESQSLSIAHVRPLPIPKFDYMPYVAPFTVNILDSEILDWRGSPYSGYQAPYIWQELGNAEGVSTVLQFMKDAQNAYENKIGVRGPFAPLYLWDRWDSKTFGTPNTWTWNGPDPNTFWGGYQYRGAETVAKSWYNDPQNIEASKITMDFLSFINNAWKSSDDKIINYFPETGMPSSTGDDPHAAGLLLRTAIYAYLAGGDETITLGLIKRCLMYLDKLHVSTDNTSLVAGTWSSCPSENLWYNYWGGEIVSALSLFLQNSQYEIVVVNPPLYGGAYDLEKWDVLINDADIIQKITNSNYLFDQAEINFNNGILTSEQKELIQDRVKNEGDIARADYIVSNPYSDYAYGVLGGSNNSENPLSRELYNTQSSDQLSGLDVIVIQRVLELYGYFDIPDGQLYGIFGPATEDAVTSYQEDNDLTADGRIGAISMGTLFSSSNEELRTPYWVQLLNLYRGRHDAVKLHELRRMGDKDNSVFVEYTIKNGSKSGINVGYIDLINTETSEIWEVKPDKEIYYGPTGIGTKQLARYIAASKINGQFDSQLKAGTTVPEEIIKYKDEYINIRGGVGSSSDEDPETGLVLYQVVAEPDPETSVSPVIETEPEVSMSFENDISVNSAVVTGICIVGLTVLAICLIPETGGTSLLPLVAAFSR